METTKLRLKKHAEEQCKILNKKQVSYNFSINDEVLVRNPITTKTSLRNEGPFRVRQISDSERQILLDYGNRATWVSISKLVPLRKK